MPGTAQHAAAADREYHDMTQLSPAGTQMVQDIASRYGLSTDAVTHMLIAVRHGNGSMAQFNHPEFGGSGQWMQGGMTMVSDLFNTQLKMLVENVCNELANALASHQATPFQGSFQSQSQGGSHNQYQGGGQLGSQNSLFVPDPAAEWWPKHLGTPTAIGAQNSVKYAYFAGSNRLAVTTGGAPWVYDTLDHQIGGFGQQQGGGQGITFTSQYGTVNLSTLPVVWRDGAPVNQTPAAQPAPTPPAAAPAQTPEPTVAPSAETAAAPALQSSTVRTDSTDDVIALLERLGQLMEKGYISEDEFKAKKAELLERI
jgi:hypothetical protein